MDEVSPPISSMSCFHRGGCPSSLQSLFDAQILRNSKNGTTVTTNGVLADVFVTPHLMHVDLTDLDTAATLCGCQAIGGKQMNVKVSLLSRHPCRLSVLARISTAAAGPFHSTKLHVCRTLSILSVCRCQRTGLSHLPARVKAQEIPVTTVRLPAKTATLADCLTHK